MNRKRTKSTTVSEEEKELEEENENEDDPDLPTFTLQLERGIVTGYYINMCILKFVYVYVCS
jgi:hypothetical protein